MNLLSNWELHIDPGVLKELHRIPPKDTERILEVIRVLPLNPYFGDIQKMKGESDVWRRRVGAYRIFYILKTSERILIVFHIERRTSTTY